MLSKLEILKTTTFGERVAEDEIKNLRNYFVKTDQWRKIFSGDLDVIYGAKGSGKSAIYSFLASSEEELFQRNILITPAEQPRGTPVFSGLITDPPASEREFIKLWKLYFLLIVGNQFETYKLADPVSKTLVRKLQECKLLPQKRTLSSLFRSAYTYVKNINSVEPGVTLGQDGVINGFKFKILFDQSKQSQLDEGCIYIDELYEDINSAMINNDLILWISLDRLDVAFSESSILEANALRALFKVYLDLMPYDNIRLKIFLRDDIWIKITESGFREASHITRHTTIAWNKDSIVHLIISRLLNNETIVKEYKLNKEEVLADNNKQIQLFYQLFPYDFGEDKSKTLDWILSRTRDAKNIDSPREIIHLLNTAKDLEIQALEIGNSSLKDKELISVMSLKKALNEVSKVKLHTVLFAEYPDKKPFILELNNEKSELGIVELGKLWGRNRKNAAKIADTLVEIGFMSRKGPKDNPIYVVPYLYRPELNMT
jgi:hypothetical protein